MPIPKPRKGEKQKDFHSRCMGDEVMTKDYPDQKQRNAVCYNAWDGKKKPSTNEPMKVFFANIDTSTVRKEQYKGAEYYVSPVVMIKAPIVMNGLFYSVEEVSKFPAAWDGRPVTLFHPKGEDDQYISANDTSVPEDVHLGILRNTWFGEALQSEVWVHIANTRAVRPEVLEYFEGKKQGLQVSTGLFGDTIQVPGEHEGKAYTGIMTNIRPDHLALLPGGEGACNWTDGCGLRANSDDTERGFTKFFVAGMSDREVRMSLLDAIVAKDSETAGYYIEAIYQDDRQVVYEEQPRKKNDSGYYEWVGKAKLYRSSYEIDKNGKATLGADAEEVYRKVTYEPVTVQGAIAMNEKDLKAKVDGLIACQRCRFEEKDREWLMTLNAEQLERITPPDNVVLKANTEEQNLPTPIVPSPKGAVANAEDLAKDQPKTAEEWLLAQHGMPQEVAETLTESLVNNRAVREEMITNILADPRNGFTKEDLAAMRTNDLRRIASLAVKPSVNTQTGDGQPAPGSGFFGMQSFFTNASGNDQKGPEPLSAGNLFDEIKKDREKK